MTIFHSSLYTRHTSGAISWFDAGEFSMSRVKIDPWLWYNIVTLSASIGSHENIIVPKSYTSYSYLHSITKYEWIMWKSITNTFSYKCYLQRFISTLNLLKLFIWTFYGSQKIKNIKPFSWIFYRRLLSSLKHSSSKYHPCFFRSTWSIYFTLLGINFFINLVILDST